MKFYRGGREERKDGWMATKRHKNAQERRPVFCDFLCLFVANDASAFASFAILAVKS